LISCATSSEVFEQLASGHAPAAVLPIENSLHGSVFEHYDLLLESGVAIVGELQLHIRHNVIAAPGATLAGIRRVLSHPVALSQCRRWLREHPGIEAVPFYDTAGSVKHLMATGASGTAGIAPALAAKQYGAEVLVAGIEDHAENYTRFYILTNAPVPAQQPSHNKASIALSLEHRPGSLIAALEVFREGELNLTKIESRPVPGSPWEYIFFVDLRFTREADFDLALTRLRERCQMVRELGRYQAAESI
jgi:prephenate dehydratase